MSAKPTKRGDAAFDNGEVNIVKKAKTLLYLSNMIYFGLSIVLIVIGICYLSVFRHDYSFSYFSITTVAGFFLAIGIIAFILSIVNVVAINMEKPPIIILSTLAIIVLYVIILIIGIWALAINNSDVLSIDGRNEMIDSIRRYDEKMYDKYDTLRVNWLQTHFNCCGIDTYLDWRTIYLYGGQLLAPNQYVDQWTVNNNLPYIDYVPDSCCIYPSYNCGKQFQFTNVNSNYQNVYGNGNLAMANRNAVINTKGCLPIYLTCLSKDLNFIGGLAVAIACVALVIGSALILIYFIVKKRI